MSVTATEVKALFPELASMADATIEAWIAVAERHHNAEAWGGKSEDGITFLAAHFSELARRREAAAAAGGGGMATALPMTGRTVDRVSVTFGGLMAGGVGGALSDAMLQSTQAGQLYLFSRESVFADRRI